MVHLYYVLCSCFPIFYAKCYLPIFFTFWFYFQHHIPKARDVLWYFMVCYASILKKKKNCVNAVGGPIEDDFCHIWVVFITACSESVKGVS